MASADEYTKNAVFRRENGERKGQKLTNSEKQMGKEQIQQSESCSNRA